MRIDLNADVGELDGEEPLYEIVSSVNIACGAHAGDAASMGRALDLARDHGVRAGAHPGYADRERFGRHPLTLPHDVVRASVAEQIGTLALLADARGIELSHVKPHGALYNQAATDGELAAAVVAGVPAGVIFVGLAGSVMLEVARASGLDVAAEAFADRAYADDGTLVPRGTAGALITDPETAAARAVALARGEPISSIGGARITIGARTICIHGDTPGSLEIARAVRRALERDGITIAPA